MKRFHFSVSFALFLLTLPIGLQAQTTQTKASQSNVIQTQTTKSQTTQTKTAQSNGTPAQTTQSKVSQVDLMKIWLGTWKAEMGNDISCTIECTSIYNGFELHSVIETKGKAIVEWKDLVGYDKISDRMIEAEIINNSVEMTLYTFWFTAPTKCQKISLSDDNNSEKSKTNFMYEFKSSEVFTSTEMKNNKIINSYTFQKVKQ
jgi:hypothetical protein